MNILIVDDHPMIVSFYESALNSYYTQNLRITKTYNCEEAYLAIVENNDTNDYDLAIIDQNIPDYPIRNLYKGTDVINLIRESQKKCKVVLITAEEKKLYVYNIIRSIKPDGIVIKNDVTNENFIEIISTVLNGDKYQSSSVKHCVEEIWKNKVIAEDYNRQILIYLVNGYRINELHNLIPLAESTIKKRIKLIRESLKIENEQKVVYEVIRRGFL